MKSISTSKLTLLLGAAVATMNIAALAGPNTDKWQKDLPSRVKTKDQAEACCVPAARVALACKDCDTVEVKKGEEKKGILAWFAPDDKHNCSGCGGKITFKGNPAGKAPQTGEYTHTCTKCGDNSAYVCTDHKAKS